MQPIDPLYGPLREGCVARDHPPVRVDSYEAGLFALRVLQTKDVCPITSLWILDPLYAQIRMLSPHEIE
jgi:hypothetical protein